MSDDAGVLEETATTDAADAEAGQAAGATGTAATGAPPRSRTALRNARKRANRQARDRAAALEAAGIVLMDPRTLLVDLGAPDVEPAEMAVMVEVLLRRGVRSPLTAEPTAAGYRVLDGRRRVLAAVAAGITLVPVRVTTSAG